MLLFLFFVYLHYGQSQVVAAGNYSFAECNQDGNIDIVPNQQTSITCTGLNKDQNIYWSITKEGMEETRIGNCSKCTHSSCPACSVPNGNYSVTRQPTNTTLRLITNVNANNNIFLKCSNERNTFSVVCRMTLIEDEQRMSMLSAVGVGVGVGVGALVIVVVVILVVILRHRGDNHGTRECNTHQDLSVDNPSYNKGPDSILPIQSADISPASQTTWSTSGAYISPDTEAHTFIEVDLGEAEEKKNSQNASGPIRRRVHFCQTTPADNVPPYKELVTLVGEDNYNTDEIDVHELSNTRLGSKTKDISADSEITISSKSTEERAKDSENGKLPRHDAFGNPLGSKKPSSTEDTPAHSDDYNHIAVNPKATEEHLQWGKLQRHDGCSNPPTTKTDLDKQTGKAANANVYSHIAINSAVGEDVRPKSQTSAGEANILDVDPYDRIQTPSHKDEPVLYENAFEKTAKECDDEFIRLKFSQLESKKTEDPEYSHISQV